jgi:hypothetical protein
VDVYHIPPPPIYWPTAIAKVIFPTHEISDFFSNKRQMFRGCIADITRGRGISRETGSRITAQPPRDLPIICGGVFIGTESKRRRYLLVPTLLAKAGTFACGAGISIMRRSKIHHGWSA